MKQLKVLIACEESQRVCIEFRKLGHEAYSADIQEPSESRSKTFQGIAQAMAQQWSAYLTGQTDKQLSFFEEE